MSDAFSSDSASGAQPLPDPPLSRALFAPGQLDVTLQRLTHQLIENHLDFARTCLLGIQPRGVHLSRRIRDLLTGHDLQVPYGELDATFHRDDFRERGPLMPNTTTIDFVIDDLNVILIDDVLYTGRTVRAALDAMLAYGRPRNVELLVLVDRKRKRDLPIYADYIGAEADTLDSEYIHVQWAEAHGTDSIRIAAHA